MKYPKNSNPLQSTQPIDFKRSRGISMRIMRVSIFTCVTIALVWAPYFSTPAAIKAEDIVLALPFDDGEGEASVDLSSNGNAATLVQGAKWGEGKLGTCLRLKNTAHAAVANHPSLDLHDTDFSLAIWMNFSSEPGWYNLMAHSEGPGGGDKKWFWMFSGGKFKFHIFNPGGELAWIDSEFFGFPDLDRWYHLAFVKQGDHYTFYLDGGAFGESVKKLPIPKEINHDLTIGWSQEDRYFQGLLDEVLIVKQALTQHDVQSHLSGGIQGILAVEPDEKLTTRWGSLKSSIGR